MRHPEYHHACAVIRLTQNKFLEGTILTLSDFMIIYPNPDNLDVVTFKI